MTQNMVVESVRSRLINMRVTRVIFTPKTRPKHVSLFIDGRKYFYDIHRQEVREGVGEWRKKNIYVEPGFTTIQEKAIIVHEAVESFLMRLKGVKYEQAHKLATKEEYKWLLKHRARSKNV